MGVVRGYRNVWAYGCMRVGVYPGGNKGKYIHPGSEEESIWSPLGEHGGNVAIIG